VSSHLRSVHHTRVGQAICQHQRDQPRSAICQGATALCKPDGLSYRLSELLRMLGTGFDTVRSVGRAQGPKICHLSSCDHRAWSPQLLPNRVCSGHVVKRQINQRPRGCVQLCRHSTTFLLPVLEQLSYGTSRDS
jgi:hypothetical protein